MSNSRIPAASIHLLWRAQLLLFETPRIAAWSAIKGNRLLIIFVALEGGRKLFEVGTQRMDLAQFHWWILAKTVLFVGLALVLVARVAKLRMPDLGLAGWSQWSRMEKIYLFSTTLLTISIFSVANWPTLETLRTHSHLGRIALFVFVPEMIWGFYQEFVYRGMLQSELVRRWGAVRGIAAGNLIFTFGPLHAYHFYVARGNPSHLWIFTAIFAIGLFFAVLFQRSRNLWIVGILHGVGDCFLDGLGRSLLRS
jgi:uncharacterized protein